jgi:hypothetical protein
MVPHARFGCFVGLERNTSLSPVTRPVGVHLNPETCFKMTLSLGDFCDLTRRQRSSDNLAHGLF